MPGPNPRQPQHSDTPGVDAAPSGAAVTPTSTPTPIPPTAAPSPSPSGTLAVNSNESVMVSRLHYDWLLSRLADHGELALPSTTLAVSPLPPGSAAPLCQPVTAPAAPDTPAAPATPAAGTHAAAATQADYATAYRIHVCGTFAKDGEHALIVSDGVRDLRINLKLVEFLALIVLGAFARRKAELPTPIDVRGGDYLTPSRILKEIMKLKQRETDLEGQADNLVAQDIYQARWSIRARLLHAELDPDLLQRLTRSGYRLSTPPEWIKITLFDDDGADVWG